MGEVRSRWSRSLATPKRDSPRQIAIFPRALGETGDLLASHDADFVRDDRDGAAAGMGDKGAVNRGRIPVKAPSEAASAITLGDANGWRFVLVSRTAAAAAAAAGVFADASPASPVG